MFKKLKKILVPIAPTLASAMGGPYAGMAVKYIAEKIGIPSEGSAGDLINKVVENLSTSPEMLQKAKEAEQQFALEMQNLNIDVFSLEVDDRKDARELAKKDMRPHIYLSIAFVAAYFVLLGVMFYAEVSDSINPGMYVEQKSVETINGVETTTYKWAKQEESLIDLFQILMGVLTAGVAQVLNFWFGGRMNKQEGNV